MKILSNTLRILIVGIFVVQLTGCGTILHPERRGQRGGSVDAGIAILDGIGLLLFLIPGIIAFAIDFNNGTIYLPGTARGSLDINNIKQVKFDAKHTSLASIEKIIKEQTGHTVKLSDSNIQVSRLQSSRNLSELFAQIDQDNDRLSLVR